MILAGILGCGITPAVSAVEELMIFDLRARSRLNTPTTPHLRAACFRGSGLASFSLRITASLAIVLSLNMSDEPRKRSRFDQREPEPRRQSRFDRRSRSPPSRSSEQRRSRSPLGRESSNPAVKDPAAAAAAAAARINADLQKKKGIQHVDVPPIRSVRPLVFRSQAFWHPAKQSRRALSKARRNLLPPPLKAKATSRTETTSRTSKSTICATATH